MSTCCASFLSLRERRKATAAINLEASTRTVAETIFKAFGRACAPANTPDERMAGRFLHQRVVVAVRSLLHSLGVSVTQQIAVVDYGMGNLRSVTSARTRGGGAVVTCLRSQSCKRRRAWFPGQGAMGDCMRALHQHELVDAITGAMRAVPFLGVCVGLSSLQKAGRRWHAGLGLCGGHVERFADGVGREDR